MRMNALGRKPAASAAAAPRRTKGSSILSIKPPLAAAAARRNLRRERAIAALDCCARAWSVLSLRVMSASLGLRGLFNGFANAHICSTAADVAGHGVVDVRISRMWIAGEQGRGRHDLARLAVPALHDLTLKPRLLNLA